MIQITPDFDKLNKGLNLLIYDYRSRAMIEKRTMYFRGRNAVGTEIVRINQMEKHCDTISKKNPCDVISKSVKIDSLIILGYRRTCNIQCLLINSNSGYTPCRHLLHKTKYNVPSNLIQFSSSTFSTLHSCALNT